MTISPLLIQRAKAFRTKKSLGQNFLVDSDILHTIKNSLNSPIETNIIEIGPGIGFLTEILYKDFKNLNVIDLDKYALDRLDNSNKINIIHADALHFDFNSLAKPLTVIGNLPFNVGTLILMNFLGEIDNPDWKVSNINEMVLMFQLEVAQRLTASSSSKAYNALSITAQSKADIEFLFEVPAQAFWPIPKVKAGIIRIKPKSNNILQTLSEIELKNLKKIIKMAFSTRRKNLKNSLANLFTVQDFENCHICYTERAENLDLPDYIELSKYLSQKN